MLCLHTGTYETSYKLDKLSLEFKDLIWNLSKKANVPVYT